MPVGREIPASRSPSPARRCCPPGSDTGSIIVVVATDAPLLPSQCERLAQRAGLGIARVGGAGAHSSGDLFLCFSTGNRGIAAADIGTGPRRASGAWCALDDAWISPLFWGAIEATEEAIVNALVAAETMTGANGVVAHALPHDRLREATAPRHASVRQYSDGT